MRGRQRGSPPADGGPAHPLVRSGWLKFHRAMLQHPVWSLPAGQTRVWLTILGLASPKPGNWFDGKERVAIQAGSFITSQDHLAKAARVTRRVVRRALEKLEQIGSIRAKVRANRWTLIEVVNWPIYQAISSEEGQQAGQPGANSKRPIGPTGGPRDLRGGNDAGGPTLGPTVSSEEGHIWRSKSGAEVSQSGGRGQEPPDPPDPLRGRLHRRGASRERGEGYSSRELEAIAGVALPSTPLGKPDGASEGERVLSGPLQEAPGDKTPRPPGIWDVSQSSTTLAEQ